MATFVRALAWQRFAPATAAVISVAHFLNSRWCNALCDGGTASAPVAGAEAASATSRVMVAVPASPVTPPAPRVWAPVPMAAVKWSEPAVKVFMFTAGADPSVASATVAAVAELAIGHPALAHATFHVGDDSGAAR